MNKQMDNGSRPATEQEQARFFEGLQEGFQAASARTGEIVRDFCVAGTSVRLRFAGEALIPAIVPGLARPVANGEYEPGCEIRLWDSETSSIRPPPPPRPTNCITGRGDIWGFDSTRYRTAYQWGEGSISAMDRQTGQAVFWVPTYQRMPPWVLASPIRSILHWWMELNGRQLVHAAAVGHGDRAVLIPGRGGSGKSSTSLACLLAGMDFIADDYLAVAMDPEPRVYRLYSTAKLDPRSLALYPELTGGCRTVYQHGFDKAVLFLEDAYAGQLRESLPFTLVLRPRLTGGPDTTLGSVEPYEVERALASETLVHLPHVSNETAEFLDRIAHEIPRAAIHLGTERERIPSVIQGALEAPITSHAPSHQITDRPQCLSAIIHFGEDDDREELRRIVAEIQAQGYSKTELIVMVDGTGPALLDEAAGFPENVRFLSFQDPVVTAEAWNRGIRDSFAELLVFLEPGDRLQPGAFDALVSVCEREAGVAWVRGRIVSQGTEHDPLNPLRGALIRKGAFRECGLFDTSLSLQGREQQEWFQRVEQTGLTGRQLDTAILNAASPDAAQRRRLPRKLHWDHLRTRVNLRRQRGNA